MDGGPPGGGVRFKGAEDGGAVARIAAGVALVEHLVEGPWGGDGLRIVHSGGARRV
jgi:hypothetical protein